MKYIKTASVLFLIFSVFIVSCTSPTSSEKGKIIGTIHMFDEPADSAKVKLLEKEEKGFIIIDSTFTNNSGYFEFKKISSGNYKIHASKIDTSLGFPWDKYTDEFYYNGKDTYDVGIIELESIVNKPALYLYPEEDSQFQVKLILNNSTQITESIPEYNSGWDVFVEKSGRIDDKYDYLFYEASIKIMPSRQVGTGWCISQKNLKTKLNDLLLEIGLNQQETNEFLDYWLNRLKDYKYYKIYPFVNQQLDEFVEIYITPQPQTIFRIWFFFQGCEKFVKLSSPQINDFIREGTTVIEWGGVLLN
ncbi:MAG: hypothetical protein KAW92_04510 [Candidatus Cloacimonetes bacterium]|nr:hypothetical protein [Candidatus Cloacimonadota bacterium]